jgi:two-component system, chemotaxis family, protein-glutamate methylesterase/glutaminase
VSTVVVVGASEGCIPILRTLISELPAGFPAAICMVVHADAWRRHGLRSALTVDGRAPIEPVNHQLLVDGRVYLAPPDHHLLLEPGEALLWHGPKENSRRPAVNALFRSAAVAYGAEAIGLVLSGTIDDGATGLWWIKRHGGITIVQDPRETQQGAMQGSALDAVEVDHCVVARQLPALLTELVGGSHG